MLYYLRKVRFYEAFLPVGSEKRKRSATIMWNWIKDKAFDLMIELLELWARLKVYFHREGLAFLRWGVVSILVGVCVGAVGAEFHHAVEWATETRGEYPWLLFLLPVAGLIIVFIYHLVKMDNDRGTEYILASVRDASQLKFRQVPLIFIATVLTHLCGGSAGREGAALQIGGGIGSFIGRCMRMDDKDRRIITMAGMAAGFSALFGTPLAAAVFAMEVESVGIMYYAAIVPCFVSALLAQIVAGMLGGEGTSFVVFNAPELTVLVMVKIIALGVLCGMLANLFCRCMRLVNFIFRYFFKSRVKKVVVGGLLIIALSLLVGRDYNGAGMSVINAAMGGYVVPTAFLMKMLFTAITLNAGYKGGEIVPSFFIGATFGCLIAPVMGLSASFGAAVGMVSVFCGVTNSPMTSILLGYELFAGVGVAPLALAVAVSYMMSGYTGLYHEQKIVYSKTKTSYIDVKGDQEYLYDEHSAPIVVPENAGQVIAYDEHLVSETASDSELD